MHSFQVFFLLAALFVSAIACKSEQAGFNETQPAKGTKDGQKNLDSRVDVANNIAGDVRIIDIPCKEDGTTSLVAEKEFSGFKHDRFVLQAKWCTKAKKIGRLRLMFLVDISGSMRLADPEVNGSCGRLDAMRALAAKVGSVAGESDKVEIAVITFGTRAQVAMDFEPLARFEKKLNPAILCQAVDKTDYEEAFSTAKGLISTIADAGGASVHTYLLTDGLPSKGTEKSPEDFKTTEEAAVVAAEALRSAGAEINAVYLEVEGSEAELSPAGYLARITGSADRVRIVSDAASIAASITEIDIPTPGFNLGSASAKKETPDGSEKIKVSAVTQDEDNPGLIQAVTSEFTLSGESGETVRNVIKLSIEASDGTLLNASIVIRFKEK